MEFDWRFISFAYSVFVSICGVVGFCIIKFNDFAHIESKVNDLSQEISVIEKKQDTRHDDNMKALMKITNDVSYLCGKTKSKK